MHVNLFLLGFATAAVGFVAIGFGIPANTGTFGNTLLIAGTTAAVGGFVLLGLGAVVRQLKRIAEAGGLHATSAASADPFEVRAQYLGAQVSPGVGSGVGSAVGSG